MTRVFLTRKEAMEFAIELEGEKIQGAMVTNASRHITLDEYFEQWMQDSESQASKGWRDSQRQVFRDHIAPFIGKVKLSEVQPPLVARILNRMAKAGYSEQTRLHAFNLLRKLFADAIEIHQLLSYNPAIRKLKPKVPLKEARHLNLEQLKALLAHVVDKPYGLAIFVQAYLGLRVGELIALRWEDIDLDSGTAFIRRTYVRKERCFRDYPKGKKQHSKTIPPELLERMNEARKNCSSEFVVTTGDGTQLNYEWYCRRIQRYCRELGLPTIGSHGIRHSTSEIYLSNGATRDDLRQLFAHSSATVTDRYIHRRTNVDRVAQVIRLFS